MRKTLIISLLFLLLATLVQANPPLGVYTIDTILEETEHTDIDRYVWLLEETEEHNSIEAITSTNGQSAFKPLKDFGDKLKPNQAYWGMVQLRNQVGVDLEWSFGIYNSYVEYWIDWGDGQLEYIKAGALRPESELKSKKERVWTNLLLKDGETVKVYFRGHNINHYPTRMKPFMFTQKAYMKWYTENMFIQGFFQGIIWIMILYNLLSFISSRDRSYLYYVLYLVAISTYFLYLYGFILRHVAGEFPKSMGYIWVISTYLSTLFYILFTRRYFDTKKNVPRGDRLLVNWIKIEVVVMVILLAILAVSFNIWLIRMINTVVMLFGVFLAIAILWQLRVLKSRIYYLYLVGASSYLLSVIVYFYGSVFAYWGWISPASFNLSYVVEVGVVLEILCFSIGLGYRMKKSEEAKRDTQAKLIEQLEENQALQDDLTRKLELKVRTRTKEIEQQKEEIESQKETLEAQNQELQYLNEEKNHLMGVLAHDLRNPLTSLLTIANLMRSESDIMHPDHIEYVGHMLGTLDRMQSMISRTLDVKATDAHDLNINWEPVDLEQVVTHVVADFRARAEEKDIHLELNTLHLRARLDTNYTEQIVENLVSNAIKFTPPGKHVWVEMRNSNGKVKVAVIDEGPGICEEDQKRLFGKYQRLSAQPTGGETSTGLGLSIVKKYVEAMDGHVWCESIEGKGATFIIEFDALEVA
ncbi:MAG: 7TM diverse intracellular signaling domain-containing protein [Flammeovirgaceae bacterium]